MLQFLLVAIFAGGQPDYMEHVVKTTATSLPASIKSAESALSATNALIAHAKIAKIRVNATANEIKSCSAFRSDFAKETTVRSLENDSAKKSADIANWKAGNDLPIPELDGDIKIGDFGTFPAERLSEEKSISGIEVLSQISPNQLAIRWNPKKYWEGNGSWVRRPMIVNGVDSEKVEQSGWILDPLVAIGEREYTDEKGQHWTNVIVLQKLDWAAVVEAYKQKTQIGKK